jgi:outer membrane protein assembly factor BamD
MKNRHLLIALLGLVFLGAFSIDANAQFKKLTKKKAPAKPADKELTTSAEPDKILYDRALADIKHGRYTEGRLSLQTLINTYPDSEYLAKAKLAVADSYYKEGGTSNLTQSVAEYKDFITFFPFLEESAYAQMQVGMAHYKMMEKADRDSSQAQMAEDEFQSMLLKYPQSSYAPQAEQRLREVQEVLADGEYKIAHYYYTKQDYRASAARLLEVIQRYPLYSQSDEALWMLGDIYQHVKLGAKNEDVRNYWGALSGKVYDRIVQEYPLSARAPEAKRRLTQMGMPVPAANPDALVRMQKEHEYAKEHHSAALIRTPMSALKTAPDVSVAAHVGPPNLNPPDDAVAASEVLKPNSAGASGFTISGSGVTGSDPSSLNMPAAPTTQEDADTSGPAGVASGSGGAAGRTLGVQIIDPSEVRQPAAADPATAAANPPATGAPAQPNPAPDPVQPAANPPDAAASTGSASSPSTTPPPAAATGTQPSASSNGSQATGQTDQGTSDNSSSSTAAQGAAPAQSTTDDSKDSSSKKKKGVRKLIPW